MLTHDGLVEVAELLRFLVAAVGVGVHASNLHRSGRSERTRMLVQAAIIAQALFAMTAPPSIHPIGIPGSVITTAIWIPVSLRLIWGSGQERTEREAWALEDAIAERDREAGKS